MLHIKMLRTAHFTLCLTSYRTFVIFCKADCALWPFCVGLVPLFVGLLECLWLTTHWVTYLGATVLGLRRWFAIRIPKVFPLGFVSAPTSMAGLHFSALIGPRTNHLPDRSYNTMARMASDEFLDSSAIVFSVYFKCLPAVQLHSTLYGCGNFGCLDSRSQ